MREMGVEHDSCTFPIMSKAVFLVNFEAFWLGKTIHGLAMQMGFGYDVCFCNTMIAFMVKVSALQMLGSCLMKCLTEILSL